MLVAVGIHTGVLDEEVCFDFYADDLMDACRECQSYITFWQNDDEGEEGTPLSWIKKNKKVAEKIQAKDQPSLNSPGPAEIQSAQ
jgi:hypothetical protein